MVTIPSLSVDFDLVSLEDLDEDGSVEAHRGILVGVTAGAIEALAVLDFVAA